MKKYHVEYSKDAQRDIKKLDKPMRNRIKSYILNNLEGCENPRLRGIALKGNLRGNWRYRVGDYRIIAKIEDDKILITIIDIGTRGGIYS